MTFFIGRARSPEDDRFHTILLEVMVNDLDGLMNVIDGIDHGGFDAEPPCYVFDPDRRTRGP